MKMDDKVNILSEKFRELKTKALQKGVTEEEIVHHYLNEVSLPSKPKRSGKWKIIFFVLFLPLLLAAFGYYFLDNLFDESYPCTVDHSLFVMEAARPVANCGMCKGLSEVPKLSGLTAETFASDYAYNAKPLVVKDATENWTAIQVFTFEFFRKLYSESETAFNVTDEQCQFFPYQTEFHTLREVFNMSKERAEFKAEPWYIGW